MIAHRHGYRLVGRVMHDGKAAWKVAFAPASTGQDAWKGTVLLDASTFDRLEIDATQTGLSAPVVSNVQDDSFGPARGPYGDGWLVEHSHVQRVVSVLGRNVTVDVRLEFTNWRIDAADFAGCGISD